MMVLRNGAILILLTCSQLLVPANRFLPSRLEECKNISIYPNVLLPKQKNIDSPACSKSLTTRNRLGEFILDPTRRLPGPVHRWFNHAIFAGQYVYKDQPVGLE